MINKWVKFNEGVDLMDRRQLITDCNLKKELIEIFQIQFTLRHNPVNHIYRALYNYIESTYNEKSIRIANYLFKEFGNITPSITSIILRLYSKDNKEVKSILIDMLDLYDEIKDDIGVDGYAKKSDISNKIHSVCLNSLDDDILNFNIIEDFDGINVEIGYPKPMNIELLSRITDELISLCGRVKDATGLINSDIEFREFIYVTFNFKVMKK